MNTKPVIYTALGLILMGTCAGFLSFIRAHQRLGIPAVKVVQKPVYGAKNELISTQRVDLPESVAGYASESVAVTSMEAAWLPPDTVFGRRLYRDRNDFQFLTSVVLMGSDRTSIHKPEYCLVGGGWQIDKKENAVMTMARPFSYELPVKKFTVSRLVKEGDRTHLQKGIYVFWFVADKEYTAEHTTRMWWIMRDMVTQGVLQRWAYITYFAVCNPGEEDATFEKIAALARASVPEFQLVPGEAKRVASAATP